MLGSIARRSVVLSSRRSATKTRELRNLRRSRRGAVSTLSARTPTRTVSVSHPTLGGLTERVERVVDTLDSMLKAGPRHLDTRQWQAGQIFRSAYEVNRGAVGNVMDFDRIRGGGAPGPPPPPRQMYACEKLNEARAILYSEDLTIIERIAGEDTHTSIRNYECTVCPIRPPTLRSRRHRGRVNWLHRQVTAIAAIGR